MVTAAVIALLSTLIYRSFFTILDAYNRARYSLYLAPAADEKMWQAQDALTRNGEAAVYERDGVLAYNARPIKWNIGLDIMEKKKEYTLFRIQYAAAWREGGRDANLTRYAYALYQEKQ